MGEGLLILCVCVLCFSCVSVCACVLGICELLLISVFTSCGWLNKPCLVFFAFVCFFFLPPVLVFHVLLLFSNDIKKDILNGEEGLF